VMAYVVCRRCDDARVEQVVSVPEKLQSPRGICNCRNWIRASQECAVCVPGVPMRINARISRGPMLPMTSCCFQHV